MKKSTKNIIFGAITHGIIAYLFQSSPQLAFYLLLILSVITGSSFWVVSENFWNLSDLNNRVLNQLKKEGELSERSLNIADFQSKKINELIEVNQRLNEANVAIRTSIGRSL